MGTDNRNWDDVDFFARNRGRRVRARLPDPSEGWDIDGDGEPDVLIVYQATTGEHLRLPMRHAQAAETDLVSLPEDELMRALRSVKMGQLGRYGVPPTGSHHDPDTSLADLLEQYDEETIAAAARETLEDANKRAEKARAQIWRR